MMGPAALAIMVTMPARIPMMMANQMPSGTWISPDRARRRLRQVLRIIRERITMPMMGLRTASPMSGLDLARCEGEEDEAEAGPAIPAVELAGASLLGFVRPRRA